MITGLFSAFSFLTINFYAQGITKARELGGNHTRVAAWRETGALLGVCVAAVSPTLMGGLVSAPFAAFAAGFAGVTIIAASLMTPEWRGEVEQEPTGIGVILGDTVARRLLLLCVMALGEGDVALFAVICIASGATMGADLTLLPALFARRMAAISPNGGQGFGLWALVNKFTLAFAAALLLPILEAQGFASGAPDNPADALTTLSVLYALVPCALKLVAIGLLLATPLKE